MQFRILKRFGRFIPQVKILDLDYGIPTWIGIGSLIGYSTEEKARNRCYRFKKDKDKIVVDRFGF